jgi:hypothetical protein
VEQQDVVGIEMHGRSERRREGLLDDRASVPGRACSRLDDG